MTDFARSNEIKKEGMLVRASPLPFLSFFKTGSACHPERARSASEGPHPLHIRARRARRACPERSEGTVLLRARRRRDLTRVLPCFPFLFRLVARQVAVVAVHALGLHVVEDGAEDAHRQAVHHLELGAGELAVRGTGAEHYG